MRRCLPVFCWTCKPVLRCSPRQLRMQSALYRLSCCAVGWEAQANYDVLANPFVYMTPALRDDKTTLFKEIEAFFRQNDVTPENVEQAYSQYLENLAVIS